jgi:hypothetical protein
MYERKDERGIPISAGVPPIVIVAASVGVILVFVIIGLVLGNSSFGHSWPAADSTTINLDV